MVIAGLRNPPIGGKGCRGTLLIIGEIMSRTSIIILNGARKKPVKLSPIMRRALILIFMQQTDLRAPTSYEIYLMTAPATSHFPDGERVPRIIRGNTSFALFKRGLVQWKYEFPWTRVVALTPTGTEAVKKLPECKWAISVMAAHKL